MKFLNKNPNLAEESGTQVISRPQNLIHCPLSSIFLGNLCMAPARLVQVRTEHEGMSSENTAS
jgi:hypothetical protein